MIAPLNTWVRSRETWPELTSSNYASQVTGKTHPGDSPFQTEDFRFTLPENRHHTPAPQNLKAARQQVMLLLYAIQLSDKVVSYQTN